MRAALLAPALAFAACTFDAQDPLAPADGTGRPDAAVASGDDAALPPPDAPCPGDVLPFTAENLPGACALPAPGPALVFPGDATGELYILDTGDATVETGGAPIELTTMTFAQPGGPDLLVVVAEDIVVEEGARVLVEGERALALVSATDLTVAGELDLGARGDRSGPGGGLDALCGASVGAPGITREDGGGREGGEGGGGGGFGTAGGPGAKVAGAAEAGPAGGVAAREAGLAPLRGGCTGGPGGGGATGGGGGGAVELVAAGAVTVAGTGFVHAGGGGGSAAALSGQGGGGGGSGGAVLVLGTDVTIEGTVAANGGGGGEGNRGGNGAISGDDGHASAAAAAGGLGGGSGGDGGAGGIGSEPGAPGSEGIPGLGPAAGGGGGGGGVGRVILRATGALDVSGTVSPDAG